MLIQRSSSAPSSRKDMALRSSSAVTASANRTPCLRRLAFALAGSHSASILCTIVHCLNGLPEKIRSDRPLGRITASSRGYGHDVAIGDVIRLIGRIKINGMAVQFAGRVCDDGCHRFLLWASETLR